MFNKLYVRIWLAVVLTVAVLILLVGTVWRLAAEPPARDLVLRNESGQVIGRGRPRLSPDDPGPRPWQDLPPQQRAERLGLMGPPHPPASVAGGDGTGASPQEPHEFLVRMHDGHTVQMHLMRPAPSFWSRPPFGFAWMLGWVGLAVALATYPIVRKLTRRLERLQAGVQQWGRGDLSIRLPETGCDEVAFLAHRFNAAADQIQALMQAQKSLLANASHELRSPLTRIRMGLELMGPAAAPQARAEIERNIAELDQLVEEILLSSRLNAKEVDMGTVESLDLLGLCAEECARAGAELDLPDDWPQTPVPGVAKLLRRAVRNLLENARRHAQGEIVVALRQQAGNVQVRVGDRGPGVPAALRERIFEPFYRLPGATERDGGVGLGLALVRSIAERHQGRAYCEARDGGGACFVIELPLDAATAAKKVPNF